MNFARTLCGIAVVVIASVSVSAQNQNQVELDSLLGELTYGDSDSPSKLYAQQTIPSAPSAGNIDSINQLPPPSLQDAGMIEADSVPSAPRPIDSGAFDARTLEIPRQETYNQNPMAIPESQPQTPVYPHSSGYPSTQSDPLSSAYPQPDPYSHSQQNQPTEDGYSTLRIASAKCDSGVCRPHQQPNLPPPCTLRQYFNSPNCYSNLWAGYAKEAQARCDASHTHIHGTCDCAERGKSRQSCDACQSRKCSRCD